MQLRQAFSRSRGKRREIIGQQLATAEAELALAQSQVDSLGAMIDFERGVGGSASSDLEAQIDQLRATVRPAGAEQTDLPHGSVDPAELMPGVPRTSQSASGMVGQAENLIALKQKSQVLAETTDLTSQLLGATDQIRRPLRDELRQINQRVLALAANTNSNDLSVVKDVQHRFELLTEHHKLVLATLLPLSKQSIILNQYEANLARWQIAVGQRFRTELRHLALSVSGLVLLLLIVIGGVACWRRLTFRYVHDVQRRHQLQQLSRIVAVTTIVLVLLFDFANELGALATVMGFAAAGIALTLQNVILSLAGYFYISGRYGIRVGDRVQISGISGDVLEIGLFKMTLMELSSDEAGRQPTGRVVVFPNSVVFQPNGNFSKQLPGSNFAWSELRLTLAPECDYRVAERRLVEVINGVFSRYRDTIQRECRGLERDLNLRIETPRPQSRLHLGDGGIEIAIRYPVLFKNAAQTSDEIARRLVDALAREPGLKLVTPGTPMIQPIDGVIPAAAAADGLDETGSEPPPHVDNRAAAVAAAAAAGATVANAFVETSAAAQKREGVLSGAAFKS
jgi:small-conductance mechanosensitive channel